MAQLMRPSSAMESKTLDVPVSAPRAAPLRWAALAALALSGCAATVPYLPPPAGPSTDEAREAAVDLTPPIPTDEVFEPAKDDGWVRTVEHEVSSAELAPLEPSGRATTDAQATHCDRTFAAGTRVEAPPDPAAPSLPAPACDDAR
jgi:hypothetical protein